MHILWRLLNTYTIYFKRNNKSAPTGVKTKPGMEHCPPPLLLLQKQVRKQNV